MIRFHCPNCGRLCEIAPVLAALPLLCKGCGQRLVVPPASESLPPPPPPAPKSPPAPKVDADETGEFPRPAAPPKPAPRPAPALKPIEDDGDDEDGPSFLVADIPVNPDIDFDLPGKTAAHESDAHRARMSNAVHSGTLTGSTQPTPHTIPQPMARPERPRPVAARPTRAVAPIPAPVPPANLLRRVLPVVVDVCVGLVLVVVGAFLGEMLAGRPTRDIWNDAGSSVKFPPIDLLMWLAPPLVLVMIYALLASRGKSLGGWLKRRQEG